MSDDDASWLREIARTPNVALPEDLGGTTLGRYAVERVLGRGGMGSVYVARDTQLDRVVALKVLPSAPLEDPSRRKRFLREVRIAAKLVHPHIATVFDAGEEGARVFLAMELVEGRTLRDEMRERGRLPLTEVVRIAGEIARALTTAHDAGIVHRDVKPENIMLAKDGAVKVLDFGIAKLGDAGGAEENERRDGPTTLETRAGALIGTPAYMSPEQAKGLAVDARSDVFSFGVVLYEMLAGARPFDGKTPLEILIAIDRDEPASLARLRPDIPRSLASFVMRCLAKKPDARPAIAAIDLAADGWSTRRLQWGLGILAAGAVSLFVALVSSRPPARAAHDSTAVSSSIPVVAAPPPVVSSTLLAASVAPPVAPSSAPPVAKAAAKPRASAAPTPSRVVPSAEPHGPLDDPK